MHNNIFELYQNPQVNYNNEHKEIINAMRMSYKNVPIDIIRSKILNAPFPTSNVPDSITVTHCVRRPPESPEEDICRFLKDSNIYQLTRPIATSSKYTSDLYYKDIIEIEVPSHIRRWCIGLDRITFPNADIAEITEIALADVNESGKLCYLELIEIVSIGTRQYYRTRYKESI